MGWLTGDASAYQTLPRALYPFAAPQAVSTPTPLLPLTALGAEYQDLVITVRNHDAANQAAFYVDRSESGSATDADRQTVYVPALAERRLEFRDVLSLWWSLSAAGDPDAVTPYPTVNVSWQVLARKRR